MYKKVNEISKYYNLDILPALILRNIEFPFPVILFATRIFINLLST